MILDTFNFLVSVLLMMIAIQFGQTWLVLAILVISVLTSKDLSTVLAFLISTGVLYIVAFTGDVESLWPVVVFGLLIVAIILGSKPEQQESPYGAGMDMFGGMGGGGAY
ncbi:MAG: hypothetical protein NUV67_00395 [archaeon]|nr:hypothetical protein [archaeon]